MKGPIVQTPFLRRLRIKWEEIQDRNEFPWCLPIFNELSELNLEQGVTFFVGENGSGKSTLMEGIAETIGMNSEGGSRNHFFSTTTHRSPIARQLKLIRGHRREQTEFFLRAESFYNVMTNYENMPVGDMRDLHFQSHGEGFLKLLLERFGPNGLYLLDEPESALSPQNILTLMLRIYELVEQGSQFIIATHSPMLLAFPGAVVYDLGGKGIVPIDYRDTLHYLITTRFLNDPESVLEKMFSEDLSE